MNIVYPLRHSCVIIHNSHGEPVPLFRRNRISPRERRLLSMDAPFWSDVASCSITDVYTHKIKTNLGDGITIEIGQHFLAIEHYKQTSTVPFLGHIVGDKASRLQRNSIHLHIASHTIGVKRGKWGRVVGGAGRTRRVRRTVSPVAPQRRING
ncbi:hypothetical protein EVAR_20571_1 [Eumeta japonica]|uniref:Uncharacterized protein n=1 Tax=Eumeta variegata TaxID=151549 RepID=A0A4C1USB0_EUMVA|nr:hypothetical protein EVAR_20571_1 [Eumeta japonica]